MIKHRRVVIPTPVKFALVVGILSAILTGFTLFWPKVVQGAPVNPLTPGQLRLVADKEKIRIDTGAPGAPSDPNQRYARGRQPVRQLTMTVEEDSAQVLADLEAAWVADQSYRDELERNGFGDTVRAMEEEYLKQRTDIVLLRSAKNRLEIPAVKVGRHSITLSNHTYSGNTRKDPVNMVFYRVGSAWDVNFDLLNWTRLRWGNTSCGGSQRIYIWDSGHTGGWDGWRTMQYQMQRNQGWICGTARHHLRLFGSFVRDNHSSGFGYWSAGGAHHDNTGHTCTDGWDNTEQEVRASFQNSNGTPLWFVGTRWRSNFNNSGRYACANNDGYATFIELKY